MTLLKCGGFGSNGRVIKTPGSLFLSEKTSWNRTCEQASVLKYLFTCHITTVPFQGLSFDNYQHGMVLSASQLEAKQTALSSLGHGPTAGGWGGGWEDRCCAKTFAYLKTDQILLQLIVSSFLGPALRCSQSA